MNRVRKRLVASIGTAFVAVLLSFPSASAQDVYYCDVGCVGYCPWDFQDFCEQVCHMPADYVVCRFDWCGGGFFWVTCYAYVE
jgi:hypothetical protein